MENDLRDLSKRERHFRKSFEAVRTFVEDFDPEVQMHQVSVRLERLKEAFASLLDVRRRIELLTDDITPPEDEDSKETASARDLHLKAEAEARERANEQIILDIENEYCELSALLISFQPPPTPAAVVGNESSNVPLPSSRAALSRVKLPEIRLPSFSGKIREWISFRDAFRSLIHENARLTDMDKFNYLRLSLTGDALQEISSVNLSAANYEVAWKALERKYENCKLIVKAHLDALFAVEVLKRESYDALSHLISEFDKHLSMLAKVGEDTSHWSTIFAHMVCSRLDAKTLRHWESHHNSKKVARYADLMEFLRNECSVLQSVVPVAKSSSPTEKSSRFGVSHSTLQSVTSPSKCPFCADQPHSAFRCTKFLKMNVSERYDAARQGRLCYNCLNPGHQASVCSRGSCHHCQRRHHSLLHTNSSVTQAHDKPSTSNRQQPQSLLPNQNRTPPKNTAETNTTTQPVTLSQNTSTPLTTTQTFPPQATTLLSNMRAQPSEIILSTAIVHIMDLHGNMQPARALLDSCSQFCFMTSAFCRKLKLRGSPERLTVQGIGGSSVVAKRIISASVHPRLQQISPYATNMNFYVLPEVTAILPVQRIETKQWNLPPNFILADPYFYEPGKVDLIIGAEYYFDLLMEGRTKLSHDGPTMQQTVFGWIISGRVPAKTPESTITSSSCSAVGFYESDSRSNSTQRVKKSSCETVFNNTSRRNIETVVLRSSLVQLICVIAIWCSLAHWFWNRNHQLVNDAATDSSVSGPGPGKHPEIRQPRWQRGRMVVQRLLSIFPVRPGGLATPLQLVRWLISRITIFRHQNGTQDMRSQSGGW